MKDGPCLLSHTSGYHPTVHVLFIFSWFGHPPRKLLKTMGENTTQPRLEYLLRRLDSKWKYDERVELGSIFDTFFFKVQRKPHQSLLEYVTDFHQALRDVQRLKVDLPEKNHWMAHVAPSSLDQGLAAPRAVPGW